MIEMTITVYDRFNTSSVPTVRHTAEAFREMLPGRSSVPLHLVEPQAIEEHRDTIYRLPLSPGIHIVVRELSDHFHVVW